MAVTLKQKRGTAAAITAAAPTPAAGELVFETDTLRFKLGTGSTEWASLAYVLPYLSATDRILGRSSAGAGPAEEITCTAAGRALLDDVDAAAQRVTLAAAPTASPTFTGVVTTAAGSASAPAIVSGTGTADCGIFWAAADVLAFATAGVERLRLSAAGKLLIGTTTSRTAGPATHPVFQFEGATAGETAYQCICGSTTAAVSPQILLARHRGSVGQSTVVVADDSLGLIRFNGGDGTDCVSTAAQIEARVDGTPGSDDMPGRLMFSTAADGANSATERLRIDCKGNVLIAGVASPAAGAGTVCIFNGTAPTGSVANGVVLYSEDVSSSAELKVRDEAGNITTLSPHSFPLIPGGPSEPMAWAYYSERDGRRINVDMLRLARLVEKLSGEKLVYLGDVA